MDTVVVATDAKSEALKVLKAMSTQYSEWHGKQYHAGVMMNGRVLDVFNDLDKGIMPLDDAVFHIWMFQKATRMFDESEGFYQGSFMAYIDKHTPSFKNVDDESMALVEDMWNAHLS